MNPAEQFVGHFMWGEVQETVQEMFHGHLFHSPPPGAVGMEGDDFKPLLLQGGLGGQSAWGGLAVNSNPDSRAAGFFLQGIEVAHALDGSGGIGQDPSRQGVDSQNVHHGMHDR